ncbi:TetR family transcriptional regulator [soil metagenome]
MSKRRGPRSGESETRNDILEAARTTFSEVGYDRATFRRIAKIAGVDPALVTYYYGKKQDLFAAAVRLPMRPDQAIAEVFRGTPAEMAEKLAHVFFSTWEVPESREALIGQLRMAFATGQPVAMREFIVEAVLSRADQLLVGPRATLRLELVASHLLGLAILRYVLMLEPVASTPIDELIAEVAPHLAGYLNPRV